VDIDARAEIMKRMNDMLIQDFVILPLVYRADVSAHANTLQGTAKNAFDSELWNIADWYRGE
jgi:peptide/nickel transport system substrate-binding protein